MTHPSHPPLRKTESYKYINTGTMMTQTV